MNRENIIREAKLQGMFMGAMATLTILLMFEAFIYLMKSIGCN